LFAQENELKLQTYQWNEGWQGRANGQALKFNRAAEGVNSGKADKNPLNAHL
jgi:hypothetical protein